MEKRKPIIIQGAMEIEIEYLMKQLENVKKVNIQGYEFYEGAINNYPIVISKTNVGEVEMSVATLLGIINYSPIAIIVQGTAGAHDLSLYKHDIVVGTSCININSFESSVKEKGKGSNPLEWELKTFKSGVENDVLIENYANSELVEVSKKVQSKYTKGKVVFGVLGSGDGWNKEWDRIEWLNRNYNTLCEDMESISTYSICNNFNIPVLGIRVISNNERIEGQIYDRTTGSDSQEFTLEVCKEYIKRMKIDKE